MVAQAGKAAAVLVGAGFIAGFFLSSGSAHLLFASSFAAVQSAGEASEPASADGKGGKGGKHGSLAEDGEGGEGNGGHGGKKAGRSPRVAKDTDGDGGEDKGAPTAAQVAAPEPSASAFLAGNTLRTTTADGVVLTRYMSRKGWLGDQDRRGLIARRWVVRAGRLCVLGSGDAAACEALALKREAKPADGVGAVLGAATLGDGRAWTVLRGNPARLPETIPLVLGADPANPDLAPAKASATGQEATDALMGHTLLTTDAHGAPSGDFYEADGRWINAQPLVPGAASGRGGVRVAIGQWRFTLGLFCRDEPGLDLNRKCFVPEQWGDRTFHLRATQTEAVTTLVSADTP